MNNQIKHLPSGDFEVLPLDDPGFLEFQKNRRDKPLRDWLDEIENYGTRWERFLNEWDTGMTPERMIEWLYAAYEIGKETE